MPKQPYFAVRRRCAAAFARLRKFYHQSEVRWSYDHVNEVFLRRFCDSSELPLPAWSYTVPGTAKMLQFVYSVVD